MHVPCCRRTSIPHPSRGDQQGRGRRDAGARSSLRDLRPCRRGAKATSCSPHTLAISERLKGRVAGENTVAGGARFARAPRPAGANRTSFAHTCLSRFSSDLGPTLSSACGGLIHSLRCSSRSQSSKPGWEPGAGRVATTGAVSGVRPRGSPEPRRWHVSASAVSAVLAPFSRRPRPAPSLERRQRPSRGAKRLSGPAHLHVDGRTLQSGNDAVGNARSAKCSTSRDLPT